MKKNIQNNGITLIALVVTLVVLLILAGISIMVLFGDNGIIKTAQEAGDKWNRAAQNEQADMKNLANQLSELIDTTGWMQNKTVVTNGTVTLEVGQAVTGYTANGVGDGNWYVLGAKDGKLLITTGSNQGTVALYGRDGYTNGVTKLNTEGAKFKDTNMAESARSIDVEDINRVTGYDPDVANYNSGNNVEQWKNEVTYTLNSDGYIHYQGTKWPKDDTTSREKYFTYWNGSKWIVLGEEGINSVTLTHNHYWYWPQTLSAGGGKPSEVKINGSTSAYALLFADTSGEEDSGYWLSSQSVSMSSSYCYFVVRMVSLSDGMIVGSTLYGSSGGEDEYIYGMRPVVSLKSNVKVTEDGALSI